MKRNKKRKDFLFSNRLFILLFAVAVGLLLFGGIGGARAALQYYSDTYSSEIRMKDIGVSLLENGEDVSRRDYNGEVADGSWDEHTGMLLTGMLAETDGKLELNKNYTEHLSIRNSGTIDSYVRVTVYRYFLDPNGEKTRKISPDLIKLHFVNVVGTNGENCFVEDLSAKTVERNVFYYTKLLKSGEETPLFADTILIDGSLATYVNTKVEKGVVSSYYDFDGYKFIVEAHVDSVQDHNAEAAILSAWGKDVCIVNGTLALK